MAGISNHALKGLNYPENRKKYNGIEFTDELDLNLYDAQLRNLDPQIGRWNQIDPKIENMEAWSPYASNYDNPIRYNDFLGDEGEDPNKKGFINGVKAGFTGFFRNAGNAIANPGQTVKAMFSPKALLDHALNGATMGVYGIAKGTADNTRVVMNEGTYGLGKIVGGKAAEVTLAAATEGAFSVAGKAVSNVTTSALGNTVRNIAGKMGREGIFPATIGGAELNGQTAIAISGAPPVNVAPQLQEAATSLGGWGRKCCGNSRRLL